MEQPSNNFEKSLEINNILSRAEKLREKFFYTQSLILLKKALRGYTKKHDQSGILHCMLSLGDTYRIVGSFDVAAQSYVNAIELARKLEDTITTADAQVGLGLSLKAQGKWKEALKLIRKSKKTYMKTGDKEGLAFTYWAEAGALRIKGDIIDAINIFKVSKQIFNSLKDTSGTGYCLCGLGGTSRVAGRFRNSLTYYSDANRLFSSIKDTFGTAYSYCGIGNAYRMHGDYKTAIYNFTKAVKLYERIRDRVSYSYTIWSLATTYKMIGNYKKSRDYLNTALRLFKKTRDPRGIIYCRLGLGELDFLEHRRVNAEKQLTSAFYESSKNSFAVEKCHAAVILSFINGKTDNKCYNTLGLKLRFQGLPFNIP